MTQRTSVVGVAVLSLLLFLPLAGSAQDVVETLALTYDGARAAAEAAEEEARANGWSVTIVVVDDAGVPFYVKRMEGASTATYEIALGKARTSAAFGQPSRVFAERAAEGGATLPDVLPLEGAVPVAVDGTVVGAVGVSGVMPGQDAQVAQAGAEAVSER